ncbi:PAS domain S-box protein [Larkinella sp. VNQ87]|uniref:PAS domain S-box protein n=1 Tax=Larkinella sp. VNQ87 TaxID=3400921 RepID=UPI003C0445F1
MLNNYHLLLQNISEAFFVLDTNGQISDSNPAASALTGYTAAELQNQSLALLYPNHQDVIRMEHELNQARTKGKLITEGWKVTKDSTPFWAEMTLAPVYDHQDQFVGYSCLMRDFSEKKQLILELKEREERYRLMVEGVKDYAIFLLDSGGHIVTWNQGAKRIKGYSTSEILGKHFSTFYTREDLESQKPANELKIAIETGKYEEEGWRVKKDGSVFWANVVITTLYNDQNELIGFSKVTRDLTERREVAEKLRQSEEQYRSLVEQILDYGIFMLDEHGRIISWNEGARRINGYLTEEILNKHFSIFYPKEDLLNGKPAYELKVAREVGKYEEEGWRIRKDGSLFWAHILITAVYNSTQTLIGFSKVTRDLTERKNTEKALRESYEQQRLLMQELQSINEELAATNEELAATNEELGESNRLLVESNQSLQQFAFVASHDLQEPLRKIQQFGDLLKSQYLAKPEEGIELLGRMQAAASRMSILIRDLLAYSRLSTRQQATNPVSLTQVVRAVLTDLELVIQETGARIEIEPLPVVLGDASQLGQLFQNLISNALKFRRLNQSPENQPAAVIPQICINAQVVASTDLPASIKPPSAAETFHQIKVTDNGIGFDEKYLNRIFQVFQRLHGRSEYAGTGIGLAICQKVVTNHGGAITASSKIGHGSTFSVYLPVAERHLHQSKIARAGS